MMGFNIYPPKTKIDNGKPIKESMYFLLKNGDFPVSPVGFQGLVSFFPPHTHGGRSASHYPSLPPKCPTWRPIIPVYLHRLSMICVLGSKLPLFSYGRDGHQPYRGL